MDKLTAIKIKHPNGQYSDPILLSVLADNVRYDDTRGLKDVVDALNDRISNIVSVADTGGTALDVNYSDVMLGADGITYGTPGDAVRANDLKSLNTVLVRETQPSESENKLWIDKSTSGDDEVQILIVDDLDIIAPIYSESFTYAAGDYVVYDGGLYRCNTNIEIAEPWDSTRWTGTNVSEKLIDVDKTLTVPDMAADAKATGDKIADLKNSLNEFAIGKSTYPLTTISNGYIYQSGGIGTDNQILLAGYNVSAATKLTLKGDGKTYKITIESGWKLNKVAEYSGTSTGYYVGLVDISSGSITLADNRWYIFQFRKEPKTDVSPSDFNNNIILEIYNYTDPSLTLANKAADAKATGDRTNYLSDRLDNSVISNIKSQYNFAESGESRNTLFVEFENGSTSGVPMINSNAFRTRNFIPVKDVSSVCIENIKSNMLFYLYFYDENYSYLSSEVTSHTKDFEYVPSSGVYYIKAVILARENQVVSFDECQNVIFTYISNKLECSINVKMEGGGIKPGGVPSSTANHFHIRKRTAFFLKTNGAKKIFIEPIADYATGNEIVVCLYDSDFSYIGYVDSVSINGATVDVSNCTYVKFYYDGTQFIDLINVKFIGGYKRPEEVKNVVVNQTNEYEYITFKVNETSCGTARLFLPSNYTPTGAKVPLILYMPGTQGFSSFDGGLPSWMVPNYQYLADEGFAVLVPFGWTDKIVNLYPNCGKDQPYVTPTCLQSIKKAIEYTCTSFNVDPDNVHVMSKSQGGQCATYFATNPIWDFKSIGMFAPVCDYLSIVSYGSTYSDTKRAIAYDMGFTGDIDYFASDAFRLIYDEAVAFMQENITLVAGMNEAWAKLDSGTLQENFDEAIDNCQKYWGEPDQEGHYTPDTSRTDIYNNYSAKKYGKVPVRIWAASDDNNTSYRKMAELVVQLQNSGCEATMVKFNNGTGGHSAADAGSNKVASVTTALGVTYTNVPSGFVQNIKWIRSKMPK